MSYKYDLFISHASEDKDFVRPLAEALRAQRLAVWYDEFELTAGLGLRESIDQGLISSRFGLVILSPSFFSKSWPRWELDGLVQLAHSRLAPTIIPIWHKVDHSDITAFSPSLANIVAIISFDDPDRTTAEVLKVLRPRPSAVEIAREILTDNGFPAPLLSDDWWLDAAVWSAPTFGEGTFQEASSWGWWGFPLPSEGDSSEAKGERIAWAAMQHSWQESVVEQKITQCSHPTIIHDFISSRPGLHVTAESNLDYLLCYAPQLGIPGCGGELEPSIDSIFREAEHSIKAHPTNGAPGWILRDPQLCNISSGDLVEHYFWSTDPAGTSPDSSVIAWVDAAAWLTSDASNWLPSTVKEKLIEGLKLCSDRKLKYGRAELWDIVDSKRWQYVMLEGPDDMSQPQFLEAAREVVLERLEESCNLLKLPEAPDLLIESITSWGIFQEYWVYNASPQF
ncbi:MAG: TIR domain-containing protein [Armatimonadota bacterium]